MLASSLSRSSMKLATHIAAVSIILLGAGCTQPEIDRPGTWQPTGANDQNLRAMLVNPRDAYEGSGATTTRGDSASRAVTRLLTDRRRPLLDAAVSRVAPSSGSQGDSPLSSGGSGASGSSQ